MAKILHFGNDSHRRAQEALPWYVTDRLDDNERAAVEAHLAGCAACRRDLEAERELAEQFVALPLNADAGWTAMRGRMEGGVQRRGRSTGFHKLGLAFSGWLARPARLGWIVASQALVLVAATAAYLALPQQPSAEYHALSAQPVSKPGNVIVMFRPDISEQRLRSTLAAHKASIVDGPTAAGAYVLLVPVGERARILADLQQSKDLLLAQPIDAEPGR
jgi:anti-sigma factor RsiW